METESVTFYLPSSAKHEQVGPYRLRREPGVESDTVHHIKELLEHPPQRLGETAWWIEPPQISYDYILVLVRHPGTGIAAYVVQMAKETMSLERIRAYINEMYGPNAVDGESLLASNNSRQGEAYTSGSILLASPPSQPPPIKPDDNQLVVCPAEESPPASFHSPRLFGDSQTARVTTAESFAVVGGPTSKGLQAPHNRPFHSCGSRYHGEGDKGSMDIDSRDQDSQVSELQEGEDVYRKSHDEIRPPPMGSGYQTQDLVVGIAPLKLRQLPPTTNDEKDDDIKHSLGYGEYRSLQLEQLKFAEEEKGGGKESASFPLTYGRRLKAAKIQLREQTAEKRELMSSPHQTETNREEESAWGELQQKVHTLEHVYNQECFLKGQCKKVPSPEALQEMSEMTKAHRDGKLDPKASDLLKQYIAAHCQMCCDPNCKIPHMAAGCPQPGVLPETVELDFSQSTTTDHTQQSLTATTNSIPKHVQEPQKFTDGKRLFTQATDDVVPSQGNRMYVGLQLAIARPHQSEDGSTPKTVYTGNHVIHAQATNSEERPLQTLESLQNGCFPSVDACRRCQRDPQNLTKKLIYCSEQFTESTGCQFGSSVAGSLRISERLGKGGNGYVYKCCLCSRNNVGEACSHCKLAAKLTHYRQRELCIWSKLKHENVTALHGVVLVPLYYGGVCIYQLMPLMTSTFQKEVDFVGNLHSLIWEKKMSSHTVTKNMHHICREIAKGLCYLHSNHIYHGDLKGSNIFICKQSGCQCMSTFLCMCPPHLKSRVYIGDFDSANYHTPGCDGDQIDGRIEVVRSGTTFYRSPEAHIGCMGPWCDLWSIGCIIVYSILGHTNVSMKPMAKELSRGPSALYQYNPLYVLLLETVNASRQEQLLLSLCKENPEPGFIHLSMIAGACLNLDFHKRITAEEMYLECLRL